METTTDLCEIITLANAAAGTLHTVPGKGSDSFMHLNQPASEYHADRGALSCSLLKPLLISPAHFKHSLLSPHESSDAQDFGSLVHLLMLEPQSVGREVAVYPGVVQSRDKQFSAFCDENLDRMVFDEPTFSKARTLVDKVLSQKYKGRSLGLFLEEAKTEISLYFTEPISGIRLRVRPDIFHPEITFDLKTTRHGSSSAFSRDALSLHYDLQAFMYTLGRSVFEGSTRPAPFVFIAAETDEPHSVFVMDSGRDFLDNGAKKFQECLSVYQACTQSGYWPDLSGQSTLDIEHWQQFQPAQSWRKALSAA